MEGAHSAYIPLLALCSLLLHSNYCTRFRSHVGATAVLRMSKQTNVVSTANSVDRPPVPGISNHLLRTFK